MHNFPLLCGQQKADYYQNPPVQTTILVVGCWLFVIGLPARLRVAMQAGYWLSVVGNQKDR